MPQVQSLDDLIAKKAIEYADQIKAAAAMADKEEEIRIESEKQLAFIQKEAGIKLEGKHEFTVASGRIDSVYSRVIIEYKNPKSTGDRIGPKGDSPGSKKVVEQIKKRFYDMRHEHGQPLNSLFGVGIDGNYFIFVRFRDEKWQIQEPVEVNRYSAERFLWALFNLGTKGKAFSPEYLSGDFGSEGGNTIAINGIHALYDAIVTTDNPKAQTFFSQWKILFGEVCGYDVDSQSEKLKKLAEFYQVGVKDPKPAELLFAVHTYYALFMKLLAAEIVAFFHKLPTPLQKMMQSTTSNKLKREMEDLEAGSIFRHLNITNFLEGDLFAWYTSVWTEPIEKLVREMVTRLDDYNPGTLSEDPTGSRDLLKKLYQQLFPKSVRHDLGEYYTPDWLAEHVLNELGYVGDPDKRLLDPACGSGTFLVMAINRIRKWYDENRETCQFNESELGRKILANVVGFDLNPLAVMAARTNYLIAIRDLIGRVDKVEIPIYLCDSIMTPSEYGGLFAGGLGKARQLKTAPTTFIIPTEITTNRDDVAKYAEQLETGVRNGYSAEEFIQRCQDDGLPITAESLHSDLYCELVKLDKANKNGIWARIIKNSFAPLFIEKADFIAGNPPWVNWQSLPEAYRNDMKPLWDSYGLFSLSGSAGRLGGGKKDLSMLFVYCSIDNYLKDGGKLGFVITQSIFKTEGAGDGFRQFRLKKNEKITVIKPLNVHDLSNLQVFEGATNRTAVFVCEKTKTNFSYPVPYIVWQGPKHIGQDETLENIKHLISLVELEAMPIQKGKPTAPWLTVQHKGLACIQKVVGKSDYIAHAGCCTWLNGVYWVRELKKLPNGSILVENLCDVGEIKVKLVQAAIEPDLVFPLLRGRDVFRWHADPSVYLILTQDPKTRAGIPEREMKRKYPRTFDYLKQFEPELRKRSGFRRYFKTTDPFYSVYNVGPYTVSPVKVVWKHTGVQDRMRACVTEGTAICDQKVILVSFQSLEEAHFFCSCINSTPAFSVIKSYIGLDASPHVLDHVAIPLFQPKDSTHKKLSQLSRECHAAVANNATSNLLALDSEIDSTVCKLWDIKSSELKDAQDSLRETEDGNRVLRNIKESSSNRTCDEDE